MKISSIVDLIGSTPILDLAPIVPDDCASIYAKLEMYNPGGSIKDRPAIAMIKDAEERGLLKPGMTIVDATAGNTGIGLAMVANLKGYKSVFFVPDRMSREKISAMRLFGAEVKLVPKEKSMQECLTMAQAFTDQHGNAVILGQFENPANPNQAQNILGPEIEKDLGFFPDGLAIGAGTGGTFTGMARWLKAGNPNAQTWLVQPEGSVFDGSEKGSYQIEGIGNSFIPKNLVLDLADHIYTVPDERSFARCRQIAEHCGLLIGGSAGANLEASMALAKQLGPGKTVVTVFPDDIERYTSKEWVQKLAEDMA